jgi:hypothetical protein
VDAVSQVDRKRVWDSFSRAVGAEPREHLFIKGSSGLEHPVQAIAVDHKERCIVLVSSEPNPRVAALLQIDVQAGIPGTKVLVARPIAIDLGVVARKLFRTVEEAQFDIKNVMSTIERVNMGTMLERSPSAFAGMGEEHLRDHFLVQLNGHFEGNATGETFNLIERVLRSQNVGWMSLPPT